VNCEHLLPHSLGGVVIARKCLLRQNHIGRHLVKNNVGNYLLWWPLDECFCNLVPCECFSFKMISIHKANELLGET